MSLFGKILALLNVFGAIALFVLAILDYGARQTWAHNVLQHELLLEGMPLDDDERDAQGRPMVHALPQKTVADHFASVGGNPQATQVDEVKRLQAAFDRELDSKTPREQTYYLARLLLPLSDNYGERQEMLAARHYFADEARLKEFRERYRKGFEGARKRTSEEIKAPANPKAAKLTFDEALYVDMRAQGGEPSDAFTMTFLGQLPANVRKDPALLKTVDFDKTFDKTVAVNLAALRDRLNLKFARALTGTNLDSVTVALEPDEKSKLGKAARTQKRAIARLLFALAHPIAEDEVKDDAKLKAITDRHSSAFVEALADTDAYKEKVRRVYAVCGLKMTLAAIADEIAEVRKEAAEAIRAQDQDLSNFVTDHGNLVEELRDRYELLKTAEDRVKDNRDKLKAQQEVVKQSQAKVMELQAKLLSERKLTADEATELGKVSTEVLKLRLEVRDAIKQTEEAEKEIRRLEAIIRARENPQRASSKAKD